MSKYRFRQTPQGKEKVLHRYDAEDKSRFRDKFKTSDGKEYARMGDGAVIRLSPSRPWRGKSERRQVLKARRLKRQEGIHPPIGSLPIDKVILEKLNKRA